MAKLTKDGVYSAEEAIRLLQSIDAFGSPVSDNVLNLISEGKTPEQVSSIKKAAGFAAADIYTLEKITADLKAFGFDVNINGSARTNSISIIGATDNKQQFKIDVSLDDKGNIAINGMPSVDGLVAKLYNNNQSLGITTLASERLLNFERALRSDSTQRKMDEFNKISDKTSRAKEQAGYIKWLNKQAMEGTLGLSSSKTQSSVFKDIAETMRHSGPNHYRSDWQSGLMYMDALYNQFKQIDNMWKGPTYSMRQRDRSDSDLNEQLQQIELLYMTQGPEKAAALIKKDKSFNNITKSRAWSVIDSSFSQIYSWGARPGTLSENGAAFHIVPLSGVNRYGEVYQPRASQKMKQTNLTANIKQMTPAERLLNGPVFSTSRSSKEEAGDFKLYTRAFVNNEDIKKGYENLHKKKLAEGMSEANFIKKYGAGLESVNVDALLYREGLSGDFTRIDERSDNISKAEIAKHLKKKGIIVPHTDDTYDWNAILKDDNAKAEIAKIIRKSKLSNKYVEDKKIYGGDALSNITLDDTFLDDDLLKFKYDRTVSFNGGKLVTPSGTYREVARKINDELMNEILKVAGYDYLDDEGLKQVAFLANRTTGSDVKYKQDSKGQYSIPVRSVAAKGVGDYTVGYFNHVLHQAIRKAMGTSPTEDTRKAAVNKFYNDLFGDSKTGRSGILGNEAISIKDLNELRRLFSISEDGLTINWGATPKGNQTLLNHTIDLMHALGSMDSDFKTNPFAIESTSNGRRLNILKEILLEHEVAPHFPSAYGMAIEGEGGYALQQGYREHDSSIRMLNELVKNEADPTKLANIKATKDYVDALYKNTDISGDEYSKIKNSVNLLNSEAWDLGTTEEHINNLYNRGKKKQAMILDIDDLVRDGTFTKGMVDNRLEYSKTEAGLVTAESFNNSTLGAFEKQIQKFRDENGYDKTDDNPLMYIKLPNGSIYSFQPNGKDGAEGFGALAPLFYRTSQKAKNGQSGYILSPEANDVLGLLNTAIAMKTEDYKGPAATRAFGYAYQAYQEDLNDDINLKGHSTYDQAHKANINHAIMPTTMSRQNGIFKQDLDNALTISKDDAEKLLSQSKADKKAYGNNFEGFTNDVLIPIYEDLFGNTDNLLTSEEQKYYDELKSRENNDKNAADYKEGMIRRKILDAITLGSDTYIKDKGLTAMLNRYPSSNGKDMRAAKFFIDSGLFQGQLSGDQRLLDLINADFDGDHGVMRLWYGDGSILDNITDDNGNKIDRRTFARQNLAAGRAAVEYQKQVDDIYSKIKAREPKVLASDTKNQINGNTKNLIGLMDEEEIKSLSDEEKQAQQDFLKHYNKKVTGSGSNLYQAIDQAMVQAHTDETGSAASRTAVGVSAAILRAFEEGFVQNAISSKKVKGSGGSNSRWWKGVTDIYDILSEGTTYTKQKNGEINANFSKAYDDMQALGVLPGDKSVSGALTPRIAASVLALMNGMNAYEKTGFDNKETGYSGTNVDYFDKLFGEQFSKHHKKFIKNGKIVNADKLKFTKETFWNAAQIQNSVNDDDRFLEKAVNERKYDLVPGTGSTFLNILKKMTGVIDPKILEANGFELKDGQIVAKFDIKATPNTQAAFESLRTGLITLEDFAKLLPSVTEDWAKLNEMAGKSLNDEYVKYISPTKLLRGAWGAKNAGFDTREEESIFDQKFQKYVNGEKGPINMYSTGNDTDRYWGFTKEDFAKVRASKEATLTGTYVHSLNELYQDIWSERNDELKQIPLKELDELDLEGLIKRLNNNETYLKRYEEIAGTQGNQLKNFLISTALTTDLVKDERGNLQLAPESDENRRLHNISTMAMAHGRGVQNKLAQGNGDGGILATELQLIGPAGDMLVSGIADLIGFSHDIDGNAILDLFDYKNTGEGKATPEHFAQLMLYARAMELWKKDIEEVDTDDFNAYLNSNSKIAQKYASFINAGESQEEKDALYKKYEKVFGFLYNNDFKTKLHVSDVGTSHGTYSMADLAYGGDLTRSVLQTLGASGGLALDSNLINTIESSVLAQVNQTPAADIKNYQKSTEDESAAIKTTLQNLDEVYNLKYKIFILDQKMKKYEAKEQYAEAEGLRVQRDELQQKLMGSTGANGKHIKGVLDKYETSKGALTVDELKAVILAYEGKENILKQYQEGVAKSEVAQTAKQDLAQYKTLMRQRTQLQTSIYGDNLKANTVIGAAQRNAYADRATFNQEQLNEIEEAINILLQRNEGNESFGKGKQEIDDKMAVLLQKGQLNANVQNRGVSTIWGSIGNQFQRTFQYFMNFGAVTKVIQGAMTTIKKVIGYAEQLDKSLTNIRIVTGKSTEEVHDMMTGYADLAEELAVSTSDVANSASEWLRQGYSISEVNDLVTSTMYLSKLGMIDTESALKNLTSTMKGFKLEASDSMDIVDKLTTLDINAATTAGEIASALSEFSNTASMAGVNLDQAAAMATTIMDVSQVSGSTAGTSLKTIISRYGNVKAGAYTSMSDSESDDTTDNLNDVEKVLRKVGISIRDSKNEFRDFEDVLQDLGDIWSTLDTVSQNAIASAFAGKQV